LKIKSIAGTSLALTTSNLIVCRVRWFSSPGTWDYSTLRFLNTKSVTTTLPCTITANEVTISMTNYLPVLAANEFYQISVYSKESGLWGFPNLSSNAKRTLRLSLVDHTAAYSEVGHQV
jgi:hypothetical protein